MLTKLKQYLAHATLFEVNQTKSLLASDNPDDKREATARIFPYGANLKGTEVALQ